jgi:hypothetical protein
MHLRGGAAMICLTFDTDHLDESRMQEFLTDFKIPGTGTFFCTQQYSCLSSTRHEIAPHPYLVAGRFWDDELHEMRASFPKAVGWRSHSCVYSHLLSEWLGKNGYQYVSTADNLRQQGITPIREAFGIWQMPIYYMENLDLSDGRFWGSRAKAPFDRQVIDMAINKHGLYVFDFHPVHLMLNTPTYEFYAAARDDFKKGLPLAQLHYDGNGAQTFYVELIKAMTQAGVESYSMAYALGEHLKAIGETE